MDSFIWCEIIEWLPKQTTAPAARSSSPRQQRHYSFENFMGMVVGFTMHSDPKVLDLVVCREESDVD